MHFLSPEDVKRINLEVIRQTGGALGAVSEANLHHVCQRAGTVSKTLAGVAAYYFHSLAFEAHAFTDGNKRTAISAAVAFLKANSVSIEAQDDELVGFALLVASGQASRGEVEEWLIKRMKRPAKAIAEVMDAAVSEFIKKHKKAYAVLSKY